MAASRISRSFHIALLLALAASAAMAAGPGPGLGPGPGPGIRTPQSDAPQPDAAPFAGIGSGNNSGSFEVGGIDVDVTGGTADAARLAGWRIAQRKGWQLLSRRLGGGGGLVSDGTLDGMVSGIVIENEQIGPNRYVARLGILFSRARAGALLGVGAQALRSAPMLVLPLQYAGGAGQVFESKSDWLEAWSRYRTGNSAIDYVRPVGTGADAMLLNAGQVGRPGRGWWRTILDQYGASDILVPVVRLYRQWPGGPIVGTFEARHGPDDRILAKFSLRVGNGDALALLLDAGVKRIDEAYQAALRQGRLETDSGLAFVAPPAAPVETPVEPLDTDVPAVPMLVPGTSATVITLQYDTPNAIAVSATEAAMRGIPGVRTALTDSLALGGVSLMRVSYDADPAVFYAALEARGWQIQGSGTTLRITRAGQPSRGGTPPPADNATAP